jgi:hypothetical protein
MCDLTMITDVSIDELTTYKQIERLILDYTNNNCQSNNQIEFENLTQCSSIDCITQMVVNRFANSIFLVSFQLIFYINTNI